MKYKSSVGRAYQRTKNITHDNKGSAHVYLKLCNKKYESFFFLQLNKLTMGTHFFLC